MAVVTEVEGVALVGKAWACRWTSAMVRVRPSWWMAPRMDHGMNPGSLVMVEEVVRVLASEVLATEGGGMVRWWPSRIGGSRVWA